MGGRWVPRGRRPGPRVWVHEHQFHAGSVEAAPTFCDGWHNFRSVDALGPSNATSGKEPNDVIRESHTDTAEGHSLLIHSDYRTEPSAPIREPAKGRAAGVAASRAHKVPWVPVPSQLPSSELLLQVSVSPPEARAPPAALHGCCAKSAAPAEVNALFSVITVWFGAHACV